MGIEPTFSAWEADVLPLNYTRVSIQIPGWHPCRNSYGSFSTGLAIRWLGVDSLHPRSSPFGRLAPSKFDPVEFVSGKNLSGTAFGSFAARRVQYMDVLHPIHSPDEFLFPFRPLNYTRTSGGWWLVVPFPDTFFKDHPSSASGA